MFDSIKSFWAAYFSNLAFSNKSSLTDLSFCYSACLIASSASFNLVSATNLSLDASSVYF
jgi:hypothetical protein